MKLIVGLGNPGDKYAGNRHNVGFMAVEEIFDRFQFQPWRRRFSGKLAEGRIGREKCLLLKPETYMNESGRSVGEALRFYKLELQDVIVIYDEIDLAAGKLKVKTGGGNAGHNGLRSISNHVGNDYERVRIGVGRPQQKAQVANYVLRDFSKADHDWLQPLLNAISAAMPLLLEKGSSVFTSDIASRLKPIDDKPQPKKPEGGNIDKATVKAKDKAAGDKADSTTKKHKPAEQGPLAALLRNWKQSQQNGDDS